MNANREAWLERLVELLRPSFHDLGYPLPPVVRVSVGFPSRQGRAKHRRRIGECWSGDCADDAAPQVFISPLLDQPEADHVLVHELVHAAVGTACGHRGKFRRLALGLGLTGSMRATIAGPALRQRLDALALRLGPYPHAVLRVDAQTRRPGSRLLKLACKCGRIVRASKQVIAGAEIQCTACKSMFVFMDTAAKPPQENRS
jgi:hypothetical protein